MDVNEIGEINPNAHTHPYRVHPDGTELQMIPGYRAVPQGHAHSPLDHRDTGDKPPGGDAQADLGHVGGAQAELRMARERYRLGAGSILELTQAQATMARADQALMSGWAEPPSCTVAARATMTPPITARTHASTRMGARKGSVTGAVPALSRAMPAVQDSADAAPGAAAAEDVPGFETRCQVARDVARRVHECRDVPRHQREREGQQDGLSNAAQHRSEASTGGVQ